MAGGFENNAYSWQPFGDSPTRAWNGVTFDLESPGQTDFTLTFTNTSIAVGSRRVCHTLVAHRPLISSAMLAEEPLAGLFFSLPPLTSAERFRSGTARACS